MKSEESNAQLQDVGWALGIGTYQDILRLDTPEQWDRARSLGYSLLDEAVKNPSPEDRLLIIRLLLDKGEPVATDKSALTPLQVLLSNTYRDHRFDVEAVDLLAGAGVPVNSFDRGMGHPLQVIGRWIKKPELRAQFDALDAPMYDWFFARDDLVLNEPAWNGWSVVRSARRMLEREGPRPVWARRVLEYAREHGQLDDAHG